MGLRRNAKQAAYSKGVRNKVQYSAKSLDISSGDSMHPSSSHCIMALYEAPAV